uniref:Uncharacterized protein n=1 Tax=Avena sativa TaxID=4498 RepID=A0ACD5YC51_AVESA
MVPRRFLNLVMKDMRVSGTYWLTRMKPEENLFYSSAVEAVAQLTQNKRLSVKPLPESTLQLPSPAFRFRSSRARDSTLAFLPFYGLAGAGGPSEGRVVVVDSGGHTLLYDAHDGLAELLPPIDEPAKWPSPISLCVTNRKKNAIRPDALYTINQTNSADFKSLVYCNGDSMAWRWLNLPEPPYVYDEDKNDTTIQSHTLLQDGKTICFSGGFGTYSFNTDSKEWTKAGSWRLPFAGCATQVPELYNLYFGFHESDPEILVALELSSPDLDDTDAPPNVLHQWRGFCRAPPGGADWSLLETSLMYLGEYRFCIAKWFLIHDESLYEQDNILDMAAVLTGVEIVNGQANKHKLNMVKHKTRTFLFDKPCDLEDVI